MWRLPTLCPSPFALGSLTLDHEGARMSDIEKNPEQSVDDEPIEKIDDLFAPLRIVLGFTSAIEKNS